MSVSCGFCTSDHRLGLKTTEICSLSLEAESTNARCCRAVLPLEGVGAAPSRLFWLLVAQESLGLWPHHPNFCLCCHMASSLCVCAQTSLFLLVLGHPNPVWPRFNLIPSAKTLFRNEVTFTGPQWTAIWGDTVQPPNIPKTWSLLDLHSPREECPRGSPPPQDWLAGPSVDTVGGRVQDCSPGNSDSILTHGAGKARWVIGWREGLGGDFTPGRLLWGGGAARAEPEGHWVLPLAGEGSQGRSLSWGHRDRGRYSVADGES